MLCVEDDWILVVSRFLRLNFARLEVDFELTSNLRAPGLGTQYLYRTVQVQIPVCKSYRVLYRYTCIHHTGAYRTGVPVLYRPYIKINKFNLALRWVKYCGILKLREVSEYFMFKYSVCDLLWVLHLPTS